MKPCPLDLQKLDFEAFCASRDITITRTLDGEYSGAVLRRLWDAWRKLERLTAKELDHDNV
jgi:hypothetical protein